MKDFLPLVYGVLSVVFLIWLIKAIQKNNTIEALIACLFMILTILIGYNFLEDSS